LISVVLLLIQLTVTIIVGIYFYRQLKGQPRMDGSAPRSIGHRELERLGHLRRISLTQPLSEQVRPKDLSDIIGQQEGIRALKAVLCSPNPQHVIIYGPPGIGKTCAARLVLEEARKTEGTPFAADAPFIEMDATCVRFDERAIADPLIGSVHDPIYQGAGQLGVSGVPQPKEGAVTRAHGGVLFLDEIGELHPVQMNKLLKVLEDRLVRFESAYYNPDDRGTPRYIHEIFKSGLPADFRLVGATTRAPEDLPQALRSRCMEVFFRPLEREELAKIASGAAKKACFYLKDDDAKLVGQYADSGRDAVNIVQMASGVARQDGRRIIERRDVEWVAESGHYAPHVEPRTHRDPMPGLVNGLAVHGAHQGAVMEIEAIATPGTGRINVTGIVEEEDIGDGRGHTMRRRSMARAAAENAMTCLRARGMDVDRYDVHVNFPGGVPVDGPSAGVAMAVAVASAIDHLPVACDVALTGELSVYGKALPVGGVTQKIDAAVKAGLKRVLIPRENFQSRYAEKPIKVIPIDTLSDALLLALGEESGQAAPRAGAQVLAAETGR
jgi:Lon-like ATP-dependent protease